VRAIARAHAPSHCASARAVRVALAARRIDEATMDVMSLLTPQRDDE
jgi:hypothetical protein